MKNKKFAIFCILILVIGAWVFRKYAAPHFMALSSDFDYEAKLVSRDNFYDEKNKLYLGENPSDSKFYFQVLSDQGNALNIKNVFDVRRLTGEPIFSVERIYGVDKLTGAHVSGFGDKNREGYLFAPAYLNKQPFTYWHVNYDAPAEMQFSGEENLYGLKVYRYEADIFSDQTKQLSHLPEVPTERGVNLDTHLQIWVEPETGYLIKYEDVSTAYFYDIKSGERLWPWNSFSNTYTEDSVKKQVQIAQSLKLKAFYFKSLIPGFILLLITPFIIVWNLRKIKERGMEKKRVPRYLIIIPALNLILVIGLIQMVLNFQQHQRADFVSGQTEALQKAIARRFEVYKNLLTSSKALVLASKQVSRQEWKIFVDSLNLETVYPGIEGMGVSLVLGPQEKTALEKQIYEEGFRDFKIYPAGERDLYSAIVFLEPFDQENQRAFGYDMYSEPIRRIAMNNAAESGLPSLSGKVTLVQEAGGSMQPGFLLYVPVYKDGIKLQALPGSNSRLWGFVYSPFRAKDFMNAIVSELRPRVSFAVYDGENISEEFLLNEYWQGKERNKVRKFADSQTFYIGGHAWTIEAWEGAHVSIFGFDNLSLFTYFLSGLLILASIKQFLLIRWLLKCRD